MTPAITVDSADKPIELSMQVSGKIAVVLHTRGTSSRPSPANGDPCPQPFKIANVGNIVATPPLGKQ
jgi:hypothetical protein